MHSHSETMFAPCQDPRSDRKCTRATRRIGPEAVLTVLATCNMDAQTKPDHLGHGYAQDRLLDGQIRGGHSLQCILA
jgi:hypothetical protein